MRNPSELRSDVIAFLARFGEVMGNLVLGILYLVLVGPIALPARLLSDPLRRRRPSSSGFVTWEQENETLAQAQRQG